MLQGKRCCIDINVLDCYTSFLDGALLCKTTYALRCLVFSARIIGNPVKIRSSTHYCNLDEILDPDIYRENMPLRNREGKRE